MKLILLLLAFLAITVQPAAAEDKTKQAAAHYRQGKAFEKQAQWDQAIIEYKAAHALDNKASHLFNIARAHDQKGDPRGAIEFYEKFLAVETDGPIAKQAREFVATATKKVADEDARKKAEAEQRRLDELAKLQATARAQAEGHLKQAKAYADAKAWVDAAASYRAAFAANGEASHLIAAAEALRKVPDLAKAKATYQEYLAKVPSGRTSEMVRTEIANITAEIRRAEQAERDRIEADRQKQMGFGRVPISIDRPKKSRFSAKWLAIGGALLVAGVISDVVPSAGENGKLDGTDFIAPALYGLGAAAVIGGVF
jgi:tetratricopeptide (TPR) repeat protein